MTQNQQNVNLEGQPEQSRPSAINPASAQGGQGENLPGMTDVDTTQTAGATATQMDREGRTLGSDARAADHGGLDRGQGPGQVEGQHKRLPEP
jgi:hypothetical protein